MNTSDDTTSSYDLDRTDDLTWSSDRRRTLRERFDRLSQQGQDGMTTAEYAVGTLAACAFAAVLITIVRSNAIKSALTNLITSALSIAS